MISPYKAVHYRSLAGVLRLNKISGAVFACDWKPTGLQSSGMVQRPLAHNIFNPHRVARLGKDLHCGHLYSAPQPQPSAGPGEVPPRRARGWPEGVGGHKSWRSNNQKGLRCGHQEQCPSDTAGGRPEGGPSILSCPGRNCSRQKEKWWTNSSSRREWQRGQHAGAGSSEEIVLAGLPRTREARQGDEVLCWRQPKRQMHLSASAAKQVNPTANTGKYPRKGANIH